MSKQFLLLIATLCSITLNLAITPIAYAYEGDDGGAAASGAAEYDNQNYSEQNYNDQYAPAPVATSGTVTEVPPLANGTSENCCPKFPVGIIVDPTFSQVVGASLYITLLRGYQAIDDNYFPDSQGDRSAFTVLGRLGKWIVEDIILSTGMVAQHEIFGHGARGREFKLRITDYQVLPYKGYTEFTASSYNRLYPNEKIALNAAGMEGTGILAKRIRDYWLASKFIDEREAHSYAINYLDQTLYALNTKKEPNNTNTGNDIKGYVREINSWYGKQVLSVRELRQTILWDLLDPYLWYSYYSMAMYIFDGSKCFEYPMIPIGDYQYLPGVRILLAPYGFEYQLNNYIRSAENTIQARFRYGRTDNRRSWGASLEVTRLWTSDLINLDAKAEIWNQPRLFKGNAGEATSKLGAGLWGTLRWCVNNQIELLGQIGYKSSGYVPGEPLNHGTIIRAGFNLNI